MTHPGLRKGTQISKPLIIRCDLFPFYVDLNNTGLNCASLLVCGFPQYTYFLSLLIFLKTFSFL